MRHLHGLTPGRDRRARSASRKTTSASVCIARAKRSKPCRRRSRTDEHSRQYSRIVCRSRSGRSGDLGGPDAPRSRHWSPAECARRASPVTPCRWLARGGDVRGGRRRSPCCYCRSRRHRRSPSRRSRRTSVTSARCASTWRSSMNGREGLATRVSHDARRQGAHRHRRGHERRRQSGRAARAHDRASRAHSGGNAVRGQRRRKMGSSGCAKCAISRASRSGCRIRASSTVDAPMAGGFASKSIEHRAVGDRRRLAARDDR